MSFATAVGQIQELCDCIVDFVERPEDLRSTALVSRMFCHSTQPHIFYRISLDTGLHSFPGSMRRLLDILALSPHLIPLIRRLSAPLSAKVLIALSGLRLSRLQEIDLYYITEDTLSVSSAGDLISTLSSLRRVITSGAGRTFADLHAMFKDCASSVEALTFTFVTMPENEGDQPPEPYTRKRALIKDLKLLYAVNLDMWFIHPSCPFIFSKLVNVNVNVYIAMSHNSGLFNILHSARQTIQRLRMPADAIARNLDIAEFPALTQLELITSKPTAGDADAVLSRLAPRNTIQLIRLEIPRTFQEEDRDVFRAIDKTLYDLVTEAHMPALRSVDVCLDASGVDEDHWRKQLPKLAACGLLTVSELWRLPDH
ncbi:hypothetical protein C8R43DRAFT_1126588 [Mycena crocata]|nr:hypothetical protein C8R43DRAFT_1126588 [Mycena crocata]